MVLFLVAVLAALASQAARFLVADEPQPSDAIVVLAGETDVRPSRGLELLRQGVAPRVFLDVGTREPLYDQRLTDIAQRYIDDLGEQKRVSVCPIVSRSTFAEVDDVNRCLQSVGARRVLIVTSDYHSRRALLIFRHRLPQYQISVAAAHNPAEFGFSWWSSREWAKTTFDEWTKMVWFEAVDRWRSSLPGSQARVKVEGAKIAASRFGTEN
jgi:uncharacterized SAM-binding protein YcdF (DUF218 family)